MLRYRLVKAKRQSGPGLGPASKVITLNRMIKKFADENDMFYLDYFPVLVDSRNGMKKEYSSDKVHPNLEPYKIMEPLVDKVNRNGVAQEMSL